MSNRYCSFDWKIGCQGEEYRTLSRSAPVYLYPFEVADAYVSPQICLVLNFVKILDPFFTVSV